MQFQALLKPGCKNSRFELMFSFYLYLQNQTLKHKDTNIAQKVYIGNMICDCCVKVLKMELEKAGVKVHQMKLGAATISYDQSILSKEKFEDIIVQNGFTLIENRDEVLIDEIKRSVVDLVHHTTYNAMVRNSDFLVEKFGKTYQYLSSLFSEHEGITLEKYIILQRIEKAKILIQEDELTLSEIAFMMGYSSVQYLSTQFKSITGVSVTDYKKSPELYRKSIDKLI